MPILRRHAPRFTTLVSLAFILVLLITACDSGSGGVDLFGEQPTQLDSSSARQLSTDFLDEWKSKDYDSMYGLVSPNARDAYSQQRFNEIYAGVDELLTIEALKYEITNVLVQGTTAVVSYQVTFNTQLLGEFSDPATVDDEFRVMRLIATPEGWRVAWSRNDIFAGWTNNSYLTFVRTPSERGNIYDRNGDPLVVQGGIANQIFLIRNTIPNEADCITILSDVLRREEASILSDINGYALDTRFFIGDISQDTLNAHQNRLLASCNAEITQRSTRFYYDHVAPHLIGYVGQIPAERQAEYESRGYPADALVGLEGIEQAFEHRLAGTIGLRLVVQSNTGVNIRTIAERPASPGESVYLTIDRQLQLDIQGIFADAYTQATATWSNGSPGASAVVMDIHTGEVLAMVSFPDYDPGVFNPVSPYWNPGEVISEYSVDVRRPLLNRATQGRYPLGSVFKIFSSIAGLDSGLWSPSETIECTGSWDGTPYGTDVKSDWLRTGHGIVNAEKGLTGSCNPFYWNLSIRLNQADPNILPDYVMQFGFGSAPPLQGVGTDDGLIPNPAWKLQESGTNWSNADAANLVIGQGDTAVNPLQVVRAVSAVANGGTLYDPLVVQKVQITGQQPSEVYEPQGTPLDIDPNVLAQVRTAMCRVVTDVEWGTAYYVFAYEWYDIINHGVDLCGKTGTAETGSKPHAWFASFAPADNPEIAIIVIVENSCEGSEVAAPITRAILEKYYDLYDGYGWPQEWWDGCTEIIPGAAP